MSKNNEDNLSLQACHIYINLDCKFCAGMFSANAQLNHLTKLLVIMNSKIKDDKFEFIKLLNLPNIKHYINDTDLKQRIRN